jgi:hypothetical protein
VGRGTRTTLALAVALLAGSVLAPGAAAAPTRAEYIAQVDPVCAQGDREILKAIKGYLPALRAERYKRAGTILLRGVRVFERSIKQVAAVEPPAEDAELIGRWLSLERTDVVVSRRMARALRKGKLKQFNRGVNRSRALEQRIDRLMGGYGFTECN